MVKKLTIDYRELMKMRPIERAKVANSLSADILSKMTPSQYAALFPKGHLTMLPNKSAQSSAIGSGGSSGYSGGASRSAGYTPSDDTSSSSSTYSSPPVSGKGVFTPTPIAPEQVKRPSIPAGSKRPPANYSRPPASAPASRQSPTNEAPAPRQTPNQSHAPVAAPGPRQSPMPKDTPAAGTAPAGSPTPGPSSAPNAANNGSIGGRQKPAQSQSKTNYSNQSHSQGLAKLRQDRFGKLSDNTIRAMASMGKTEVGGMSAESKQKWLEASINRAYIKGKSLDGFFKGAYWERSGKSVSKKDLEEWKGYADSVMNGQNMTNYMTDNASGKLAASRNETRRIKGQWSEGKTGDFDKDRGKGEFLYVDNPQMKGRAKLMADAKQIDDQLGGEAKATGRTPPSGAGSYVATPPRENATTKAAEKATGPAKTSYLAGKDDLDIPSAGPKGKANRFSRNYQGGGQPNIELKKIDTPYGKINVNKDAAVAFGGFFQDMKDAGAPLKQPGSYNPRQKRWGGGWSEHAFGNAVDFDDTIMFSKQFQKWREENPGVYENLKDKWGIVQPLPGKDPAHHEFGGNISNEAYDSLYSERYGSSPPTGDPSATPEGASPARSAPPPPPQSATTPPPTDDKITDPVGRDITGDTKGYKQRGTFKTESGKPLGMVFHHTSDNHTADRTREIWNQSKRRLTSNYFIERDGTIVRMTPDNMQGAHFLPAGKNGGWDGKVPDNLRHLSNENMAGVEVSAKNNADVTPAQVEAQRKLLQWHSQQNGYDPKTMAFGHNELNVGHREEDEGLSFLDGFRKGDYSLDKSTVDGTASPTATAPPAPPTPMNQRGLTTQAGHDEGVKSPSAELVWNAKDGKKELGISADMPSSGDNVLPPIDVHQDTVDGNASPAAAAGKAPGAASSAPKPPSAGPSAAPAPKPSAPAPKASKAPSAMPKVSSAPKPKMASGGTVRGSGEEIDMYDKSSKKKLGEIRRGENVRFDQSGKAQVTPDRRVDPRMLENQRNSKQEAVMASADKKSQEQHIPTSKMSQPPQNPGSTDFGGREQWGAQPTNPSFVRAMEQARGKKSDGGYKGSRYGEDQNSAIS
jgi:hypothetical protein